MDLLPLLLLALLGVLVVWLLRRPARESTSAPNADHAPAPGPVVESSGNAPDDDQLSPSGREPAAISPAAPAFVAGLVTGAVASELLEPEATRSTHHEESADASQSEVEELLLFRYHGARDWSGEEEGEEEEDDDGEDQRDLWEADALEDDDWDDQ